MALTSVEREPGAFRATSPGLRLFLLCILSITLMVLDHRNQHLVGVRVAVEELRLQSRCFFDRGFAPAAAKQCAQQFLAVTDQNEVYRLSRHFALLVGAAARQVCDRRAKFVLA